MSDLVAFIKARLGEDEAIARKTLAIVRRSTAGGQWTAHYGYNLPYSELRAGDVLVAEFRSHRPAPPLADGEDDLHAVDVGLAARMVEGARRKAERALREAGAMRKILDDLPAYGKQRRDLRDHMYLPENASYHTGHADGTDDAARWVLRHLAAVYSDHADYDPAWTPETAKRPPA